MCVALEKSNVVLLCTSHNFLSLAVCGSDTAKTLDKISHTPQRRVEVVKEDQNPSRLMFIIDISLF